MSKKFNTRKAKVLQDGNWVDFPNEAIKKDMIFKMYEKNGEQVFHEGHDTFIATGDSYIDSNGIINTPIEKFYN